MDNKVKLGGHFTILHTTRDGRVWRSVFDNMVVNQGLQNILDVSFMGSAATSAWYLGLTDDTPTVASTDTMASHAGWVEFTGYNGTRKAWTKVRSDQQLSNTASVATFSVTSVLTIGGAFLSSTATGASTVLMAAGAFTGGDRAVATGDTVQLTYTFAAEDA